MPLKLPEPSKCRDCGVTPGSLHVSGCCVETCGNCGGQRLSCDCSRAERLNRVLWTGLPVGYAECHDLGWFTRLNPIERGYVPCHPDDEGAGPDINRLVAECEWDAANHRFVTGGSS
jgi:hypothetical protein